VGETPKRGRRITVNVEVVKEHENRYCGYYAILTNDVKDPVLALRIYRDKDVVEKCMGGLKNQLDRKRLRTHGRFSTDGRLLVQFIAVTVMSALRNKMRELKLDEKFTVRQLLADLETLSEIRFSGRYGKLLTETTEAQRAMMERLGVPAETWLQE
jgi:transposase